MSDFSTSARPYARAVFAIASEHGDEQAWQQFLAVFSTMIADEAFAGVYKNPTCGSEQIKSFVLSVAKDLLKEEKASVIAGWDNLVALLLQYNRLPLVPSIEDQYTKLLNEEHAVKKLRVTSALALSDAAKAKLKDQLSKKLNADCQLAFELDNKLIGGVEVQSDTWVMDASVSRRLEKLVEHLT